MCRICRILHVPRAELSHGAHRAAADSGRTHGHSVWCGWIAVGDGIRVLEPRYVEEMAKNARFLSRFRTFTQLVEHPARVRRSGYGSRNI